MIPDLFDISHHNTITSWADVELVPIIHKVNEGRAQDREWLHRAPIISQRTEIFGGYTVLIVSHSTIEEQVERYAELMTPFWRDGAFTQLDVEPWDQYERPVDCDEIEEAQTVHDEIFGPDRLTVYINPNQLPATFAEWQDRNPTRPLWLPNYSSGGVTQAHRYGATVHQYTSKHQAPGFTAGIDANRVLDWDRLRTVCHLDQPEPAPPQEEDVLIFINDTQLEAVFTLDGIPISHEVLEAMQTAGVPYLLVDQDHDYWRAAVSAQIGALAGFRYGLRYAERHPDG